MVVFVSIKEEAKQYEVKIYAPQVNCPDTEKQEFWKDLQTHLITIPRIEQRIICRDLNGYMGGG